MERVIAEGAFPEDWPIWKMEFISEFPEGLLNQPATVQLLERKFRSVVGMVDSMRAAPFNEAGVVVPPEF
jgi:hypothetical protein